MARRPLPPHRRQRCTPAQQLHTHTVVQIPHAVPEHAGAHGRQARVLLGRGVGRPRRGVGGGGAPDEVEQVRGGLAGLEDELFAPAPDGVVDDALAEAGADAQLEGAVGLGRGRADAGAVAAPELGEDLGEAGGQVVVVDARQADGLDGLVEEAAGVGGVGVGFEEAVEELGKREAAGEDHLHHVHADVGEAGGFEGRVEEEDGGAVEFVEVLFVGAGGGRVEEGAEFEVETDCLEVEARDGGVEGVFVLRF